MPQERKPLAICEDNTKLIEELWAAAYRYMGEGALCKILKQAAKCLELSDNCSAPETPQGVGDGEVARLREQLSAGERFLNACFSAWSCGEPEHRVQTMLDRADEFRAALDTPPPDVPRPTNPARPRLP